MFHIQSLKISEPEEPSESNQSSIIVIMDAGTREEMLIRGYRDKSRRRSGTRLQGYADCGLEY